MDEHSHDTIRRIARQLTHEPNITDSQIVTVAIEQGCEVRNVASLAELETMENFLLLKHLIRQGDVAGLTRKEMAGGSRSYA